MSCALDKGQFCFPSLRANSAFFPFYARYLEVGKYTTWPKIKVTHTNISLPLWYCFDKLLQCRVLQHVLRSYKAFLKVLSGVKVDSVVANPRGNYISCSLNHSFLNLSLMNPGIIILEYSHTMKEYKKSMYGVPWSFNLFRSSTMST